MWTHYENLLSMFYWIGFNVGFDLMVWVTHYEGKEEKSGSKLGGLLALTIMNIPTCTEWKP